MGGESTKPYWIGMHFKKKSCTEKLFIYNFLILAFEETSFD